MKAHFNLKKLITISLLALFCLNILGYRMVAHYYAEKSTIDMQVNLDQKKYNEADLVSFKLPLNQPYIINTDGYESLEGNMDYNGVNYQFIKKRIINTITIHNIINSIINYSPTNFCACILQIVPLCNVSSTSI